MIYVKLKLNVRNSLTSAGDQSKIKLYKDGGSGFWSL